jgi:phage repressor protein C with HTH and peptisase S24 domain
MLTHSDIWRAIDRLAERHGLSPSGLARKAGLSPTLFNPSKRVNSGRKRWPSTESVAAILQATGSSLDDFVAMSSPTATQHTRILLLGLAEANQKGYFDDEGRPFHERWDEMGLPASTDPDAFAFEISNRSLEPIYKEGDRIILSPGEKPRRGDRVAARTREGEILIKQLGREGAQKIELISLNPDYPPLTLARKDVVWLYRITWASQ